MIDFETGEYTIDDRSSLLNKDRDNIKLAQLFGIVATVCLVYFGVRSYFDGLHVHGTIMLALAGITMLSHFLFSKKSNNCIHTYFIIGLMALLLVYLLYSGGSGGSGPLWFYVFPLLAFFLVGLKAGLIVVALLCIASSLLVVTTQLGFDTSVYNDAMVERFIAVFFAVTIMAMFYEQRRHQYVLTVQGMYKEMSELASTDYLTNIPNRRYLNDSLRYEVHRASRKEQIFSIVIGDIDHFKNVNDEYGHDCGDQVLINTSKLIRDTLRAQDVLGRWGGEEFLMILPDTDLKGGESIAEKLRAKIESYEHTISDTKFFVTMSFGVVEVAKPFDLKQSLILADERLYKAKSQGRNQVGSS